MYCTNCGAKIRMGGTFCGRCGYQVAANDITGQSDFHEMEIIGAGETKGYENFYDTVKSTETKTDSVAFPEPINASPVQTDFFKENSQNITENISSKQTEEPLAAFPEITDGFPDPTNNGIMNVAANATETDRITSSLTEKSDYQNTDSPSFHGENNISVPPNTAYSYVSGAIDPAAGVGIINPKTSNEDEKVFFGKSAFALCLVVIGLLSIACGVLAGLHFNFV